MEVINAAHGGATIDKEYAILREFVIPLDPDIVLLTFVTNDIPDIKGKSRQELLPDSIHHNHTDLNVALWLLTKTATLEAMTDLYFRIRLKSYRVAKANLGKKERKI